jgi:hypothetical protein
MPAARTGSCLPRQVDGAGAYPASPPDRHGCGCRGVLGRDPPPRGWWPLAPVGVALLTMAVEHTSWTQRLAIGATLGVVWCGTGLAWMASFTVAGYALAVVIEVCLAAAAMSVLAVPAGWGALGCDTRRDHVVEAIRYRWPFGGFPLAALAHGQTDGRCCPSPPWEVPCWSRLSPPSWAWPSELSPSVACASRRLWIPRTRSTPTRVAWGHIDRIDPLPARPFGSLGAGGGGRPSRIVR